MSVTSRERSAEIRKAVSSGLTTAEIAKELGVNPSTAWRYKKAYESSADYVQTVSEIASLYAWDQSLFKDAPVPAEEAYRLNGMIEITAFIFNQSKENVIKDIQNTAKGAEN